MKGPFLDLSMERATVRKSGCWICGVAEEGDVLCGKAIAAMWVFPQAQMQL
jgi:ferredoxin-like protein FixX